MSTGLENFAQQIILRTTSEENSLPEEVLARLKDICNHNRHAQQIGSEWNISGNLGTHVLFSGPPGTGKTMAAEFIATDLGLPLYRIDLSAVVSKYIGETEKNLEQIFTAADTTRVVLLFDEADALFGKRTVSSDVHDRYAHSEISYLLQKLEKYSGIAILATNLRQNIDSAFVRRIHFVVDFPVPDSEKRQSLWKKLFIWFKVVLGKIR